MGNLGEIMRKIMGDDGDSTEMLKTGNQISQDP